MPPVDGREESLVSVMLVVAVRAPVALPSSPTANVASD